MVGHIAFLLLVSCICLQHTGASDGEGEPPAKKQKTESDCTLHWNKDCPIILYESTHAIILPEKQGNSKILKIKSGKDVTISCPQTSFKKSTLPKPHNPTSTNAAAKTASIRATCNNNGKLQYMSDDLDMKDIECSIDKKKGSTLIKDSIKDMGATCASNTGKKFGIGFETYGNYFYTQIEVCFDKTEENTLWTEHILHGKNFPARIREREGSWRSDGLFSVIPKEIYYTPNQKALFVAQLGRPVNPPQKFIAKGHMSPNADFVTLVERKATFHYINALPQWQAGNNGNWKRIEARVQNLAETRAIKLKIISGGYGVLKLKNTDNPPELKSIYLGNYRNGPDKVPVPELTWKIVIDEDKGKGVAFVVINNPLLPDNPKPKPICNALFGKKDMCGQLKWLVAEIAGLETFDTFTRGRIDAGYTYCCTVSDLVSKINTMSKKEIIPKQRRLQLFT